MAAPSKSGWARDDFTAARIQVASFFLKRFKDIK